jgi:phosphatidylglycerophosphate synthase
LATSESIRRESEIEEITNLYVIHPVSNFLTLSFVKLGITPNAVSLAGMGFGILAGFAYHRYRDPRWAVIGFLLMVAWHVMDGADGQLARLTNTQSELGKVLDGICDYVTFAAVYSALAWSLSREMGESAWLLAVIAGTAHAVQSAAYEAQRQEYSFWGLDKKSAKLAMPRTAGGAPGPMGWMHRLYIGAQLLVTGPATQFRSRLAEEIEKAGPEGAAVLRARYRAIFAPAIRRWSILSANYRTIGLFVGALIGLPQYYFLFEIFGFSVILAGLLVYHASRYRLLFESLPAGSSAAQASTSSGYL